jgi:small subunit ribosomal protein S6
MTQTKRNYHATFILDNRGKEETIDQIIEGVKKEIAAVQGDVTAVENLGKRDFARVTDSKFPDAVYVQIDFAAPADGPRHLHERLRLNTSVYRAIVQSA